MASEHGERADDRRPEDGRQPWSGNSTPPDVYGARAKSHLSEEFEQPEATEEDLPPASELKGPHRVRQSLHDHLSEMEESGDYDLHALAPLRYLLDQDWTDPNVRSRLSTKVQESLASSGAASLAKPAKPWHQEDPANSETIEVPVPGKSKPVSAPPSLVVAEPTPASGPSVSVKNDTESPKVGRKVRPWLLAVGVVLISSALAAPESMFLAPPVAGSPPRLVLSSEPPADVYRGEEHLGQTPLLLEADQVEGGLTLKKVGFQPQRFALEQGLSEDRIEKHRVLLEVAQAPLDWTGLPADSRVSWEGEERLLGTLESALPGSYKLEVNFANRPPIAMTVTIASLEEGYDGSAVKVGELVQEELAKQPVVQLTLKSSKKQPKLPLAVSVAQSAGGKFQKTARLDGKEISKFVLPGPGSYEVKIPASATHQAYKKTVTLKEGAHQNLEIALAPVPPKVAPPPVVSSGGGVVSSSGGYVPPPVYYAPPPARYTGGGGGGASIAPPSF